MLRIRLGTCLWLLVVLALVLALGLSARREARLRAELRLVKDRSNQLVLKALKRPFAVWFSRGSARPKLELIIRDVKRSTRQEEWGPLLSEGVLVYVDPAGLQDASDALKISVTLSSRVKRPSPGEPTGEALMSVLEPLGLGYYIQDGTLVLTDEQTARQRPDFGELRLRVDELLSRGKGRSRSTPSGKPYIWP
jgi:hypothetical protein